MQRALIGLGSNVGDRAAQLQQAIELLRQTPGITVRRVSSWHQTAPVGGPDGQEPFLNGAALVETMLSPQQLHRALANVETRLGRQRDGRWQARTIDLDLLLFDSVEIETAELTIPHPRFAFRRFAIEPAAEIAPEFYHPIARRTLAELRDHLRTAKPYVAITGLAGIGKTRLAHALAEHFSGHAVDSPRLPITVADPLVGHAPGRVLAWELELLAEREALLAASWPSQPPLVVSDFWLGQSLIYLDQTLGSAAQEEFMSRYRAAVRSVPGPKFVVHLSRPVDFPEADVAAVRDDSIERYVGSFAQRYVGPVLHLRAGDWDTVWTEVTAAIAASL